MSAHAVCQSLAARRSGAARPARRRARTDAVEQDPVAEPGSRDVTMSPVGSATPLASSRMYSGCSGRSMVATTDSIRSSRIVRHTQPFARLITTPSTPDDELGVDVDRPEVVDEHRHPQPVIPSESGPARRGLPAPREPVSTVARRRPTVAQVEVDIVPSRRAEARDRRAAASPRGIDATEIRPGPPAPGPDQATAVASNSAQRSSPPR